VAQSITFPNFKDGLAMGVLLHVNASPRGAASKSLVIANRFLDAYRKRKPELKTDTLNLFEDNLPEFGTVAAAAKMAAFSGQDQTAEQAAAWAEARAVFDRLDAADTYLFNVPMWNAGVPYVLKQWIDIVTQPGWVFGFDPEKGYSGLLTGKSAVVVYTCGVYATNVPMEFGIDFHSTFFNDWLRFIGVTNITELRLDGNALVADQDKHLAEKMGEAEAIAAVL
jgi:FMN-dependent NADH-azoreductase